MVVLCLTAGLMACGFHLRGETRLPFTTLYIAAAPNSAVANEVRRSLQAEGSARIVAKAEEAQAVLQIISDVREQVILSITAAGRVAEYNLRQRVTYRVADAKNQDLIPANEIIINRVITIDDTQVLSKQGEQALLYRDMQSDAAQQILRRLVAVKMPS
jgi:LPS-assembly lipoprotein